MMLPLNQKVFFPPETKSDDFSGHEKSVNLLLETAESDFLIFI
jgi:hypothetical protein